MKETLNSLMIKRILPPHTKRYRTLKIQEDENKEKTLTPNLLIFSAVKKYGFVLGLFFFSIFFYLFPVFSIREPLKKDFSDRALLSSITSSQTMPSVPSQNVGEPIQSIPFTIDESKSQETYSLLEAPNVRLALEDIGDRENTNNLASDSYQKEAYILRKYTVKKEDTLWSIANGANINVDSLISSNQLNPKNSLQVGQELKIPSLDGLFIKVKTFDTLASLSEKYHLNEKIILNDNPSLNKEVHVGQNLFLRSVHYSPKERKQLFSASFKMPLQDTMLTSPYGFRYDEKNHEKVFHSGITLLSSAGSNVSASVDGKVKFAGNTKDWGNIVIIQSQNGYESRYAGLSTLSVKTNQMVKQGEILGTLGSLQETRTSSLYFEARKDGKIINPNRLLALDQ